MKKLLFVMILLWGGGAAGLWYYNEVNAQRVWFRTVTARQGDLLATINATGTLEPQELVDVSAQIAGEIRSFGKDPRDPARPISSGSPVDQGMVLARLDDSLFKARVNQARANLGRSEADVIQAEVKLKRAERDLDRVKKLWAKHQVSASEFDAAAADADAARGALAQAESSVALSKANLEEADVNLRYTTILSPVKGVVVDRRVNLGHTLATSLFLIAKDLSRLEIWASVNESDVVAIHVGQGVRFTVAGLANETFRGKVEQVRLNASMNQGVVTYTVVIDVDNSSGKLLPYLTTRVLFELQERKDVLLVPNAALRWQPKVQQVVPASRHDYEVELRQRAAAPRTNLPPRGEAGTRERATLWARAGEFVRPIPVEIGLTDGVHTEVIADSLREGTEVVIGVTQQATEDEASATPFLPKLKNNKAK